MPAELEKKLKHYEWDVTLHLPVNGDKYLFTFVDGFFSNGKIPPYDFVEILADNEKQAIQKFKEFVADRPRN